MACVASARVASKFPRLPWADARRVGLYAGGVEFDRSVSVAMAASKFPRLTWAPARLAYEECLVGVEFDGTARISEGRVPVPEVTVGGRAVRVGQCEGGVEFDGGVEIGKGVLPLPAFAALNARVVAFLGFAQAACGAEDEHYDRQDCYAEHGRSLTVCYLR